MSTTLEVLGRYTTPETVADYAEAIRLCILCEQDQLTTMIEQELTKLGEGETADIILGIYAATDYMLREIIRSHDVEVVEQATLTDLNCVLETLLEIPYYMDTEAINRICESDSDSLEQFAELGQLVTKYSAEKFLTILSTVSTSLIERLLDTTGVTDSIEKVPYPQIVHRLKHYLNFLKTKDLIGSILIYNDIVLGMPFERYIAYFAPRIDEWSPEQAAKELLYILYMSRDGFENPAAVFEKYSTELFHDLEIQNKTNLAILTLISNFTVYLNSAQALEFDKNEQV